MFNRYDDSNQQTATKINDAIKNEEYSEVLKVTPDLIQDALKKLKAGKSDTATIIGSDILKFGSKLLLQMLSLMYKLMLVHGVFPISILECMMIPLIKDTNGDTCDTSNYRSIALSSVFLKLYDWIVISLYGKFLA